MDNASVPQLVARRRYGSVIAGAVLIYLVLSLIYIIATQPSFQWGIVGEYMFNETVLNGLWMTIVLTAAVCALGMLLGLVLAVMMSSKNNVLKSVANTYVWAVRGVPALVQVLLWYNLAALFPTVNIGIPPFGPTFFEIDPNVVITPFLAALLGLGICDSAYMAEIIRGGINSVPKGQREAAAALGISGKTTMLKIVLPQAMRAIMPAIGNQVIGNLKYTSLASIVGTMELLTSVQRIYAVNFQVIPLLLVASIWYIIMTTILTLIQRRVEGYFGKGFEPQKSQTVWEKVGAATGRIKLPTGRAV